MAAFLANLPPFLNVPGKPSIPWHLWKKIFEVHLKAAGGSGWEDERRATPAALGTGAVSKTATEYDTLLQFLDGLFAETTNVLAERHLFTSREQLPGETFLEFVAALKENALSCKFGATYDDRVRDGVANAHVRAKLLSYGEGLTLQKAEEVGRDLEALNKANAAFGENQRLLGSLAGDGGSVQRVARGFVAASQNGGSASSAALHVTQHGGGFPRSAGGRDQDGYAGSSGCLQDGVCGQEGQPASKPQVGPCFRCGKSGHLATSRNCPAKNKTCQFCRIKGHFVAVCRERQASVQEVAPVQDADSGTARVLSVQAAPTSPRELRIPVVVGGHIHMSLLVDTAATASMMTKRDFDALFASKHRLLRALAHFKIISKHRVLVLGRIPPGFQHLPGRAKRRQHILRRLPVALRQQNASELRRLQDDDVIVDDRIRDWTSATRCSLRRPFAVALLSSATLHLLKPSFNCLRPSIARWDVRRKVLGIPPHLQ
ncbi:hypothetical protein HPB52_020597 [Rhipicephalus sanguineus]|uniref:CCHC-type domain-containing protein n=1 Tax=Rhipicephalus sanguineus TaxID=34632 RepID=A0A9D4PXQ4_RHISA|nr:hypothetical protein HPB52_020597 [Rhipicephalus sanguineus]